MAPASRTHKGASLGPRQSKCSHSPSTRYILPGGETRRSWRTHVDWATQAAIANRANNQVNTKNNQPPAWKNLRGQRKSGENAVDMDWTGPGTGAIQEKHTIAANPMVVINLFGPPSSGKSTVAAGLFFLMKINKMRVELVNEFAKELVLEGRDNIFGEQNYIFAEQLRRQRRLEAGYEFAVTDSPILLPLFYELRETPMENRNPNFAGLVMKEFEKSTNFNYLLCRKHGFETVGRRHDEGQSLAIDGELRGFLSARNIEVMELEASPRTPEIILADIRRRMDTSNNSLPFAGLDAPEAR